MKKLMMLGTLLTVSVVAFANTAPETTASAAAETSTQAQQVFGAKADHKGERDGHRKHGDHKRDGKHDGYKAGKQGGFFDESAVVKNLAELKNAADNTPFMLEGNIIKQVGKNHFIFKDKNGVEQEIEVSKRAWQGETVTPADNVQIRGKVDKEFAKMEFEVKQIQKVK